MSEATWAHWTVVSGYGGNTQQPFVEIILRPQEVMTQMSPAKARELAMNLLEAAEAAEADAFLVHFTQNKIGAPIHKAVQILVEFREWRLAQQEEAR